MVHNKRKQNLKSTNEIALTCEKDINKIGGYL